MGIDCEHCGLFISSTDKLIIDDFDNVYCTSCGELIGNIDKKDIEEKNNKYYKAIIKYYIK